MIVCPFEAVKRNLLKDVKGFEKMVFRQKGFLLIIAKQQRLTGNAAQDLPNAVEIGIVILLVREGFSTRQRAEEVDSWFIVQQWRDIGSVYMIKPNLRLLASNCFPYYGLDPKNCYSQAQTRTLMTILFWLTRLAVG